MKDIFKPILLLLVCICIMSLTNTNVNASNKKAKFITQTTNKTKTFKGKSKVIDHCSYKRVILKGKSTAVKKINKKLKKHYNEWKRSVDYSTAEYAAMNWSDNANYYNRYTAKVMYNNKGIISIRIFFRWFQGGVTQMDNYCYTFNLKTGKLIKLKDISKKSTKKLNDIIKNKLKKKFKIPDEFLNNVDSRKLNYYIKGRKIIICINKYDIVPGTYKIAIPY